jgi:transposase
VIATWTGEGWAVFVESEDDEQIIERVAALDVGKAEVVCCVRLPGAAGGKSRVQEVSTHSTMVGSLCELANRLVGLGVERVVMEATSDWRPPFYLFEAHGLEPWLVNAKDVKHLPGRPKTDKLDAVWLCKVAERQMLRHSFVPPANIRRLRDLTRYRTDLVGVRTAEKNRVEKLLEDACIKLSVVASDAFGVSGRAMMAALIAGERDPAKLADLARARMRPKIPRLEEAFAGLRLGTFDDHHRFLLARMLARIDAVDVDIAALDTEIGQHLAPFADAVDRLDEIPGIGPTGAAIVIAEIGLDMTRFPTPAHLTSWAKFAPGVKSSAGKTKGNGSTGHGNRYLAAVIGEAATTAGRTDTFLGARYRRIIRRRGKKKAVVAVGRSMLVSIWHLLADPDTRFHDLGADHYDRHLNTAAKTRNHIRQLEALGFHVTLEPAA